MMPIVFTNCSDLWGYQYNWTDSKEGWTKNKRENMIFLEHEITERFDYPSYTKNGYKKMKIPQDIYQLIQSLRSFYI